MMSIMKAKKKPFEMWSSDEFDVGKENFGLEGSLTQVIRVFPPPKKEKGEIFTDEPKIAVEKLLDKLSDVGVFYFDSC